MQFCVCTKESSFVENVQSQCAHTDEKKKPKIARIPNEISICVNVYISFASSIER